MVSRGLVWSLRLRICPVFGWLVDVELIVFLVRLARALALKRDVLHHGFVAVFDGQRSWPRVGEAHHLEVVVGFAYKPMIRFDKSL